MTDALPTWQPFDSGRAGRVQTTVAAWIMVGALVGTGGSVVARDNTSEIPGNNSVVFAPVNQPDSTTAEEGFSVELRSVREALHLSVADMARLFGVSRPTIYSWLRGERMSPENSSRLREVTTAIAPHLELLQSQPGRVANRAIEGHTTLSQKLEQGADAGTAISTLVAILHKEQAQRTRLALRLADRTITPGIADSDTLG